MQIPLKAESVDIKKAKENTSDNENRFINKYNYFSIVVDYNPQKIVFFFYISLLYLLLYNIWTEKAVHSRLQSLILV